MSDFRRLVDKLWSYCNVLRDDGVSTIDYVEQLTYLLFLKMAHERETRPLRPEQVVPADCSWQRLLDADGNELETTYRRILEKLGRQQGVLGVVFRKAQNKVQDPAKLKRLVVDLIGKENWSATGVDIKGDAYEELLAKGAEDVKSGAGQYFTPRALIQAVVDCIRPTAHDTVSDPACGTGGFLLEAHRHASEGPLTPEDRNRLRSGFVSGVELVDGTARLAAMNMLLHGIVQPGDDSPIEVRDSLLRGDGRHPTVVLANPPFGRKSSITMVGADGREAPEDTEVARPDFWVTTSNKQLNFVQHIAQMLAINGRAAVVLPDGAVRGRDRRDRTAAAAGRVRRAHAAAAADRHLLRRRGEGERAVLRPQAGPAGAAVDRAVVGLRPAHQPATQKQPLRRAHLDEFVQSYRPGEPRSSRTDSERWKSYPYADLVARDKANLDLLWLRDASLEDADGLPAPEVLAREIVDDLEAALAEFAAVAESLEKAAAARTAP